MLPVNDAHCQRPPEGPRTSPRRVQTGRFLRDRVHGAALNPFEYRDNDAMAPCLKLGCGADFVVTQLDYDRVKYEEILTWMDFRA